MKTVYPLQTKFAGGIIKKYLKIEYKGALILGSAYSFLLHKSEADML